jgi:hypothetical protein
LTAAASAISMPRDFNQLARDQRKAATQEI